MSKLTKENFQEIADVLRTNEAPVELVKAFADMCARSNGLFDRNRFMFAALGPAIVSDNKWTS